MTRCSIPMPQKWAPELICACESSDAWSAHVVGRGTATQERLDRFGAAFPSACALSLRPSFAPSAYMLFLSTSMMLTTSVASRFSVSISTSAHAARSWLGLLVDGAGVSSGNLSARFPSLDSRPDRPRASRRCRRPGVIESKSGSGFRSSESWSREDRRRSIAFLCAVMPTRCSRPCMMS